VFRVAYGIQPLLDRGIDGRGKTVTILVAAPSPHAPAGPDDTGIRQDLAAFDRMFGLPAARIQIVTALAGAASPGQASFEEVMDLEIVHMVAPAAALRVVLMPANVMESAATGTADMIAALRLAVSSTDVTSISWIAGEHFFTRAQVAEMHSVLLGAAARHVTVDASSGDAGASSAPLWGSPVKEVGFPASDPLVLAVGGTTLTARPVTGAYIGETAWGGTSSPNGQASGGGFSHLYARPAYQDGVPGSQRPGACPTWRATLASWASRSSWPAVAGHRSSPPGAPAPPRRCGGTHGAGRPVRPSRPRLRQPRHLPHRPPPQLPQGIPRRYDRQQHCDHRLHHGHRLPGRSPVGTR
jgi:subtilase family serine protease